MGCFNRIGFLSGLPIEYGDETVLIFLKNNEFDDNSGVVYATDIYSPTFLPIFGDYDEYGKIENIEDTPISKYVEEFFGDDIESIITKVDDNSVGRNNEDLKMPKNDELFQKLTFCLEHKSVYDKLVTEGEYEIESIDDLKTQLESGLRDHISPGGERFGERFDRMLAKHKGIPYVDKTELFINQIGEKTIREFLYFNSGVGNLNSKYFPSNYGSQSQDHILHYKMLSLYRNIIVGKLSKYDDHESILKDLRTEVRDERITDILS